jgi:hypothetical protein
MQEQQHKGFVYVKQVSSPDELITLLEKLWIEPSYYFLRSPHAVSGIRMKLLDKFPGFEGQMFNFERELRWKKQGNGYEVLLLSRVEADPDLGFKAVPSNRENYKWEICDHNAYFYKIDETKFPKGFTYKGANDEDIDPKRISIGQRYFKDSDTATVHFVALTVSRKND